MDISLDAETHKEIITILNKNKIDDLKRFLNKRGWLNDTNQYLNYLFHFIQAGGIFVVSIAETYQMQYLTYVGVGLNTLASVVHIIINDNKKVNKQLFTNIKQIKENKYLDESVIEIEDDKSVSSNNNIVIHTNV
jgi:hypothetical protein